MPPPPPTGPLQMSWPEATPNTQESLIDTALAIVLVPLLLVMVAVTPSPTRRNDLFHWLVLLKNANVAPGCTRRRFAGFPIEVVTVSKLNTPFCTSISPSAGSTYVPTIET